MAKQLAQEIYELAENDHTWNTDDLKSSVNQSQNKDFKKWRETLKSAIKLKIDGSNAMTEREYNLYDNNFPVNTIKSDQYSYHPLGKKNPFIWKGRYTKPVGVYNSSLYIRVINKQIKAFLDEVVYQLNLEWYPVTNGYGGYKIVVTWDHWVK